MLPPPRPKLCAFLACKFTTQLVDTPARTPCSAQDTFKQWELERRVPPPPPPLRVAVQFAGESTYTGTYPPHALAPPQLLPPAAAPRARTLTPFQTDLRKCLHAQKNSQKSRLATFAVPLSCR